MQIAHAIQSVEIGTAIRESAIVYPVIMTTHLACIAVFGGMILMTDLRLLGVALKDIPVASVVGGLRLWKRIGFCIMITMGILLAGSEAEKYAGNPFFWWKMVFLGGVIVHALAFRSSVYAKAAAAEYDKAGVVPGLAKFAAGSSLFLWTGVVTFGRLIGYYEPKNTDKPALILHSGTHAVAQVLGHSLSGFLR